MPKKAMVSSSQKVKGVTFLYILARWNVQE
nr:unnamed protein product [Callosobruchus chinensis]